MTSITPPAARSCPIWSRGDGSTDWSRDTGDVGIWHETYRVRAGEYEVVYGNMPLFGLAAAGRHRPAGSKANSAAARIGAAPIDDPAVAPH